MPVIIPDWYGPDWIREALRDEDIMLAGAASGPSPHTLFGQASPGVGSSGDATGYTLGIEFSVSAAGGTLTAIWFYSPPGVSVLPGLIALYQVTGPVLVHSETASWSGAAGSGWVRAAFTSPPSLTASTNYKAAVNQASNANWYAVTAHDWDTGAHAAGASNGPLSAPNNAGASPGQDSFHTGAVAYPDGTFNASNYWVDPEVTV